MRSSRPLQIIHVQFTRLDILTRDNDPHLLRRRGVIQNTPSFQTQSIIFF